ncbi:MAG: hypothetical protein WDM89_17660 [Rhizomicrobium sp.]
MNQYKFYFLDDQGHIFRAQDHLLRDDLDALAAAKKLCNDHIVEVWQGAREVARVKQGDEPLNACDARSL